MNKLCKKTAKQQEAIGGTKYNMFANSSYHDPATTHVT